MTDSTKRNYRMVLASASAAGLFLILGLWKFVTFQVQPPDRFYQPDGYIRRVNQLIDEGKLYYEQERTSEGYRSVIKSASLNEEESFFYNNSWLQEDIEAFNDGNSDVFLIERGRLKSVNIYRHRTESPLAGDWNWWGRIYSKSSEGYAYLWNSRRTLKLYRPPLEERASAKAGQSDFREVVYGRGHLFQTGLGIQLKGRNRQRIADVYALGENIVLKSYSPDACSINGHLVARGQEQRLEEGDLIRVNFGPNEREEFLFHDFSQKPLSFVNVLNGRVQRTNLDGSFQIIDPLAGAIETAVKKTRQEKRVTFDLHLAMDEDLAGLTQNALESFSRQLSRKPLRSSCTIMDINTGRILVSSSMTKKNDDINENLRLHPVGSATKVFLAAAALQDFPDLLSLRIEPHPAGEERDPLGYGLQEGYRLRGHPPRPGDPEQIDFTTYLGKSCNRYHALLMLLALARDSASASGAIEPLFHGMSLHETPVPTSLGRIFLGEDEVLQQPSLDYFVSGAQADRWEVNNLDSSELGLQLERLFGVKRKFYEGSGDFFSPDPWNLLLARMGLQENPELYPLFYPVMPRSVNFGLNLNIDFRLDFFSILFGGATNRWNNIHLAESTSRVVTNKKIQARFIERISENGEEKQEPVSEESLGIDPVVQNHILRGMEAVCVPGGTAGDLYSTLQKIKRRVNPRYSVEFYAKTGTPFRREIRKGKQDVYSSVLLFSAVLRNRSNNQIEDGLTFAIYFEDLGEHHSVDFLKVILERILQARRWTS